MTCLADEQEVRQIDTTSWESMAEVYEAPEWFVDGKIGVWMHWGIPSSIKPGRPHDGSHYGAWMYGMQDHLWLKPNTPADKACQELAQWHIDNYGKPEDFGYEDLIPDFKAEKWDPDALTKFFKEVGANFIMPVATHHDNFDMYDSFHPWNAVKMGPKVDTIQGWKDAATKHDLKFGVSTHLYWSPRFFNTARKYQTEGTPEWEFFNCGYSPKSYSHSDEWNEHWYKRCWELIEKYDPDMFNNDSPYPNLKTGKGLGLKLFSSFVNKDLSENAGKQSVVLSYKDTNRDRNAFTYNLERGMHGDIQEQPWMWATDVSGIWFYRNDRMTRMSKPVFIANSIDAISKNGIVMMNVALRGDGTLPENQAEHMQALGDFLKINGEGIYKTRAWKVSGEGPTIIKTARTGENLKSFTDGDYRFTKKGENELFVFSLVKPTKDLVVKTLASDGPLEKEVSSITMLGSEEKIIWERSEEALKIDLPKDLPGKYSVGFKLTLK